MDGCEEGEERDSTPARLEDFLRMTEMGYIYRGILLVVEL